MLFRSLQNPTSKMSKSTDTDAGIIYLTDSPSDIEKKFKRAVTDSDNSVSYDRERKPGVSNLLDILSVATNTPVAALAENYSQYGKLKTDTGAAVAAMLEPIRTRYEQLKGDPGELSRLLRIGAERAQGVAATTLDRAYRAIGLAPR